MKYKNSELNKDILKTSKEENKTLFYTHLSKIDCLGLFPNEDSKGLFFVVNINNKKFKMYQSDEYKNISSDKHVPHIFIFKCKKNNELHIINDYESE